MKQKILESLKTTFKDIGLGDKAFDGVAEFLSKTVKEESDIQDAVNNSKGLLQSFQSEVDRRVSKIDMEDKNLELKIKDLENKKNTPPSVIPEKEKHEEIPNWAKPLIEQQGKFLDFQKNEEVNKKISQLKSNVKVKMIGQKLDERLCDKIISRLSISNDDTIDTLYETGIKEYNEFKNLFTPEAGEIQTPEGGDPKDAINDYFKEKKIELENEHKLKTDIQTE